MICLPEANVCVWKAMICLREAKIRLLRTVNCLREAKIRLLRTVICLREAKIRLLRTAICLREAKIRLLRTVLKWSELKRENAPHQPSSTLVSPLTRGGGQLMRFVALLPACGEKAGVWLSSGVLDRND